MRGHICKRSEKSYTIYYDLPPDPTTGNRRQKGETVRGDYQAAERLLRKRLTEIDEGQYVEPKKITVREYMEEWLEQAKTQVRQSTWESYVVMVRKHIVVGLGKIKLTQLTALQIQRFYREQLQSGRMDGRGTSLSPRTVRYIHAILKQALGEAVKLQIISRNVAEAVTPPRSEERESPPLGFEVAARLLDVARGTRYALPILIAVTCGLRRGEILGLRWSDVDLERASLEIKQTLLAALEPPLYRFGRPKTGKSRRPVALDDLTLMELRTHRKEQLERRLLLGSEFKDRDLVICRDNGSPWPPNNFRQGYVKLAKRAKCDNVRFHDLRHLHGTELLRDGVHPKVVQERYGHTRIATTLDTYSHAMPDIQAAAVEAINRRSHILREALKDSR